MTVQVRLYTVTVQVRLYTVTVEVRLYKVTVQVRLYTVMVQVRLYSDGTGVHSAEKTLIHNLTIYMKVQRNSMYIRTYVHVYIRMYVCTRTTLVYP